MTEPHRPGPVDSALTPHHDDHEDQKRLHALERSPALLYALVAGVVFWSIHVTGMAAITPYVCTSGETFWYHVLSVGTAIPTALAFLPGWRLWRTELGTGGLPFLGGLGLLVTAISLLAILAEWVPVFFLDACAR